MQKTYLTAQQLLTDSYQLAINIYHSDFRPDLVIGIWRGGAPVTIAVHEMLQYLSLPCDHIAVRTSSYTAIGQRNKSVTIDGLDYLNKGQFNNILLVDDVFDSGNSIKQLTHAINSNMQNTVNIRSAVPYYKPANNQTDLKPDFYLYETADWLVFPHELSGLSLDEALAHKAELAPLKTQLTSLLAAKV